MSASTAKRARQEAAAPAVRHPKRICQVCLAYDDHPHIEALVTADGPLGNHPSSAVARVAAILGPLLPENITDVEAALMRCGTDVAAMEQVYLAMIPDIEQYDAARAWHKFLHQNDFGAHWDCYRDSVPPEHQLQMAIDATDPDTGEVISVEDKRKAVIDDPRHIHSWAGVDAGLKGQELRAHLAAHPPIPDFVPAPGEVV